MEKNQDIIKILKKHNSDNLCFIDVGAKDKLEFIESLSSITNIIGFEPNPIEIEALQRTYKASDFKSLKLEPVCLSNLDGETKFNITKHASMSSMLDLDLENYEKHFGEYQQFESWREHVEIAETITSTSKKLDTYFTNKECYIDYLKLDTQGTELEILKGSEQLIKSRKINILKIEVSTIAVYENQVLFSDIDVYLRSKGYILVDFITYKENYSSAIKTKDKNNHYAPCGDAIYVLEDKVMSNSNKIKSGLLLLWLGYCSLGCFYLKASNLNEADFKLLSQQSFTKFSLKELIKNFCPPIALFWYKKLANRF